MVIIIQPIDIMLLLIILQDQIIQPMEEELFFTIPLVPIILQMDKILSIIIALVPIILHWVIEPECIIPQVTTTSPSVPMLISFLLQDLINSISETGSMELEDI